MSKKADKIPYIIDEIHYIFEITMIHPKNYNGIKFLFIYYFTNNSWSTLPINQNLPTPRAAAMVANYNGKLLVIGGEVQNELVYGVETDHALKITEQYDPAT